MLFVAYQESPFDRWVGSPRYWHEKTGGSVPTSASSIPDNYGQTNYAFTTNEYASGYVPYTLPHYANVRILWHPFTKISFL